MNKQEFKVVEVTYVKSDPIIEAAYRILLNVAIREEKHRLEEANAEGNSGSRQADPLNKSQNHSK